MSTSLIDHPADDALTAYALGAADKDVEMHIASCPSCSRQIMEVRAVASALGTLPDEDVPPQIFNKILKAARGKHGGFAEWFSLSCARLLKNTFVLIGGLIAVIILLYIFVVFVL